ncbi:ABC-type proline/glycine betaine transport systems, periplasmic components [Candidatus Scalindua japonica]|uniref:ABC-type proline/glycine betaine transport systems, periplasmic components n=1 Tax=Candidatus Scalindua japonica TaxID=1284222 RepID=A0A286U333_9BACT|nr:hypothetical protein [Candidatus Scalindua japonica]GAX62553.1 ABC-type proline/glycine betaine transport systems, periplasmic components [Candidatus Scalindua japonica]
MTRYRDYKYEYRIDDKDAITFVDQDWLQFAQENEAPDLTLEKVIGSNLLGHIEDDATRSLYKNLFDRIRTYGISTLIPYRCDSPTLRREFDLIIQPLENWGIKFKSKISSITISDYNPLLDISVPRSKQVFEICSCCKNVLFPDKTWKSLERALTRVNLSDLIVPEVTNSVCPKCTQLLQEWIK